MSLQVCLFQVQQLCTAEEPEKHDHEGCRRRGPAMLPVPLSDHGACLGGDGLQGGPCQSDRTEKRRKAVCTSTLAMRETLPSRMHKSMGSATVE